MLSNPQSVHGAIYITTTHPPNSFQIVTSPKVCISPLTSHSRRINNRQ